VGLLVGVVLLFGFIGIGSGAKVLNPGGWSKMPGCIDGSKTWVNHIGFYIVCFLNSSWPCVGWTASSVSRIRNVFRKTEVSNGFLPQIPSSRSDEAEAASLQSSLQWFLVLTVVHLPGAQWPKMPLVNISGGLTGPNHQWVRHLPKATIG
jgi:hypothetical protein